jgi:hypothetical protein
VLDSWPGSALTRALCVQFTAALQARGVTVVPFQLNYTSPAQVRPRPSRQHHARPCIAHGCALASSGQACRALARQTQVRYPDSRETG